MFLLPSFIGALTNVAVKKRLPTKLVHTIHRMKIAWIVCELWPFSLFFGKEIKISVSLVSFYNLCLQIQFDAMFTQHSEVMYLRNVKLFEKGCDPPPGMD